MIEGVFLGADELLLGSETWIWPMSSMTSTATECWTSFLFLGRQRTTTLTLSSFVMVFCFIEE